MALLYMSGRSDGPVWQACLAPHAPGLDFRIHPDSGSSQGNDAAPGLDPPPFRLGRHSP